MNRLSREKKQQLLLVAITALGVVLGLWFGLIRWQQANLDSLQSAVDAKRNELREMKDTIANASQIKAAAAQEREQLGQAEAQMASGDHYAWIINTLRDFRAGYDVDIPQYSTILTGKTTLLPDFPYSQAKLTIAGTAYYHDLGRFVADFENRFRYLRLENLQLEPATTGERTAGEKLAFRIDVVALVRPDA